MTRHEVPTLSAAGKTLSDIRHKRQMTHAAVLRPPRTETSSLVTECSRLVVALGAGAECQGETGGAGGLPSSATTTDDKQVGERAWSPARA